MAHLIEAIRNVPIADCEYRLRAAHQCLVENGRRAATQLSVLDAPAWGTAAKRHRIVLAGTVPYALPRDIGKPEEVFAELVNMCASIERLLETIPWLRAQGAAHVVACHPTTSSEDDETDLVIDAVDGRRFLVEVCDVQGDSAGQNGKEQKTLAVLGCSASVPLDGVQRLVSTSTTFAEALTKATRKWAAKHYRYNVAASPTPATTILEITPA